eukprot:7426513-Ditylum_brightwellii.AAC.1
MAYQRFTNLSEKFYGYLLLKTNADMELLDFMDQPCSCNCASWVNGKCAYKGKYRKMPIIYKAQCKISTKAYIGCTPDMFKAMMRQHYSDVIHFTSTKT